METVRGNRYFSAFLDHSVFRDSRTRQYIILPRARAPIAFRGPLPGAVNDVSRTYKNIYKIIIIILTHALRYCLHGAPGNRCGGYNGVVVRCACVRISSSKIERVRRRRKYSVARCTAATAI